jgi:hypothetical protein
MKLPYSCFEMRLVSLDLQMRMFNPVLNPELAGFFGDNMEFDDNWSKNSQNVVIDSNVLVLFVIYWSNQT